MRGFPAAMVAAVGAVVLGGAMLWGALDPGPIGSIVVNQFPADEPGWQIAIDRTNRYTYTSGAGTGEERGAIAFGPFAAELAASAELRFRPSWSGAVPPGTYLFWIRSSRGVFTPDVPIHGGAFGGLRAFAIRLHDAVVADVRRRHAPRVRALTTLRDLERVTLDARGCYGPCGIFTLALARDGVARIVWRGTALRVARSEPDTPRAQARVRWATVVAALHAAHVERLAPRYPLRGFDFESAALRFRFRRWTYAVDGPDATTWPPEFGAAFRALRGLAARAAWSPRLSATQLAELRPASARAAAPHPAAAVTR